MWGCIYIFPKGNLFFKKIDMVLGNKPAVSLRKVM